MLRIIKHWFCFAWAPLYFGGSSESNSETKNITDTQDNRIAAATDSANVNASRANIGGNLVVTDNGAVANAFDFAKQISAGAANENAASLGAVQATASSALDAVSKAYQNESSTLADAYTTAKAGEQKVMVAGALALVAIVAVKVFGKG